MATSYKESNIMKIDCHVHTRSSEDYCSLGKYDAKVFCTSLAESGFDGAAIYSLSPLTWGHKHWSERMQICLDICKSGENLFPFYWITPNEENAMEQVDEAIKRGFVAFKMIPSDYEIGDKKTLDLISKIAGARKPVMFHSGICWDGVDSANKTKPANFNALIEIPNLKFCLAHVGWPWYDECIALYGKFWWKHKFDPTAPEMFIDLTPGTPEVYRDDVFRHLLLSYNMRNNLMFGTDCNTDGYVSDVAKRWQEIDNALYEKYVKNDVVDFKERVYGKNFLRFIGKDA